MFFDCIQEVDVLPPEISNVNGDGSESVIIDKQNILDTISGKQYAKNRFRSGWIIEGKNLDNVANVELRSQEKQMVFTESDGLRFDEGGNSMKKKLLLPSNLLSGAFALVLMGSFGEVQAQIYILQGEKGDQGGKGDRGEPGPKGEPGDKGDPGELIMTNKNHWFEADSHGWSVKHGDGAVVEDLESPSGYAYTNLDDSCTWIYGTEITVDPRRTYIVRGMYRNMTPNNSDGNIYLAVRLTDALGNEITGDGTWWYYPASNINVATNKWHSYEGRFGAGTARTLPEDARKMTVGAILNYHTGGQPGNRIFNVTGLSIEACCYPP